MATTETIIIDVQVTENKLGEVAESISKIKDENARLRKEMRTGTTTWAEGTKKIKENEAQLKLLQATEKQLAGQLAISTSENRKYGDSNIELRAQLSDLERQYNSLTSAQKNTEAGRALLKQQNDLKKAVKASAEELGNFQDSVGDYENKIVAASKSIAGMKEQLKTLNAQLETMDIDSQEFKDTKRTIDNLSLAIDQASGKVDEFGNREPKNLAKKNFEDTLITVSILGGAVGALSEAFSENENVQEALLKTQKAIVLSQTLANIVKEKGAILDTIQLVKDKALIGSKIALNVITKLFGVTSAQAWAMATLGLSALITGIVLLISNFDKVINRLKAFFGITDNFKEVKKNIDLMTNAIKSFSQVTDLYSERLKTEGKNDQQILDFKRRRFEEELRLHRKLYSDIRKLGKEATDEQKEQLKKSAEFIKNSSFEQFKFDTEQIRIAAKQKEDAAKRKEDAAKKQEELRKARIEAEKQEVVDNLTEQQRMEEEITKSIERIEQRKIEALKAVENVRKLISKPIEEDEADIGNITQYLEDVQKAKDEITKAGYFGELELQRQKLDAEYEAAIENAKETGASTFEIEKAYSLQKQKLAEQEYQGKLELASGLMGNLSDIFGEQTELGKAAAAAQIAIETYKGAMAAYTSLAAYPPLAIAAAAAVGVVGAKKIKDVYAVDSKFADGGIVGGSSFSGDNLIARVNSGEMILNAEQQKRLFDMIAKNNLSGGSSFNYEMLAMAISRMPAPKLIMKEFNDYQGKIVTFDEQIKI